MDIWVIYYYFQLVTLQNYTSSRSRHHFSWQMLHCTFTLFSLSKICSGKNITFLKPNFKSFIHYRKFMSLKKNLLSFFSLPCIAFGFFKAQFTQCNNSIPNFENLALGDNTGDTSRKIGDKRLLIWCNDNNEKLYLFVCNG